MERNILHFTSAVIAAFTLSLSATASAQNHDDDNDDMDHDEAAVEFDEAVALIEINATDGDAGFHVLLDADAWKEVRITSPDGDILFEEEAKGNLERQGLTENFFESDEPLCKEDQEEPDARVLPLADFLERFPAGEYPFSGETIEDEPMEGTAELTHDLPAAPTNITFDGSVVTWAAGTDLGECQHEDLDGLIPDPSTVEVVGWEVAIEPADEEAVERLRVFSIQLSAGEGVPLTVTVPSEFVRPYLDEDVTEFKVEVGAIEASGNRTFSEDEFELGEEEPEVMEQ